MCKMGCKPQILRFYPNLFKIKGVVQSSGSDTFSFFRIFFFLSLTTITYQIFSIYLSIRLSFSIFLFIYLSISIFVSISRTTGVHLNIQAGPTFAVLVWTVPPFTVTKAPDQCDFYPCAHGHIYLCIHINLCIEIYLCIHYFLCIHIYLCVHIYLFIYCSKNFDY